MLSLPDPEYHAPPEYIVQPHELPLLSVFEPLAVPPLPHCDPLPQP